MKKQITLELEEELIAEFKELPEFWYMEKEILVKPTIQETLIKYIIESINRRRIELATSQAAINTDRLEEKDISIKEARKL